jgi:predicted DNA-binding ribbon-helix-helix protein
MNNFDKLKKRATLGAPPTSSEIKNNLQQPETLEYVDGRTLRKTGRTHQLSTRVTDEFYKNIKMIAARDGIKIVELLEKAVALYESDTIK